MKRPSIPSTRVITFQTGSPNQYHPQQLYCVRCQYNWSKHVSVLPWLSRLRAGWELSLSTVPLKAELGGLHPGGGVASSLFEVTPFLRNAPVSPHPVYEPGKCTRAGVGTWTLHCLMGSCRIVHSPRGSIKCDLLNPPNNVKYDMQCAWISL